MSTLSQFSEDCTIVGGTTGQVLTKNTNNDVDFDMSIMNPTTATEYKKFCKAKKGIKLPTFTQVKSNFVVLTKLRKNEIAIDARYNEYPSIGDQLDAYYKRDALGDSTDIDAIHAKITAIKANYPKIV